MYYDGIPVLVTNECNGICLFGADLGVPEYGGVAYAHPDCPEHGDPLEYDVEEDTCGSGDEYLRYVREEDVADAQAARES